MVARAEGDPAATGSGWAQRRERGSVGALRVLLACLRILGPRGLVILLPPISLYFSLFATAARRASKSYLSRVDALRGRPRKPGFLDVYRHVYSFATTILDRLAIWSGSADDYRVDLVGREVMEPLVEARSGAMLVGAHFGNFDMLRVVARDAEIPVNVMMYSANAERINDLFSVLDPESRVRIIPLGADPLSSGMQVRGCVERGEFVAIAADRVQPGGRRSAGVPVQMLGGRVFIPDGPFRIANVLGIPVLLVIALRVGPRHYEIRIESISDGKSVPRAERPAEIERQVAAYASRLEAYCLEHPLQWYNFYDFWSDHGAA